MPVCRAIHQISVCFAATAIACFSGHAAARNGSILVIEDSFNGAGFRVTPALQAAGWSVTETSDVPSDIGVYDQVWDVRYIGHVTEDQRSQYVDYLAGGGRMYMAGENNGQSFRNTTVRWVLEDAGSGPLQITNTAWVGYQAVTGAGSGLFPFSEMEFNAASLFRDVGTGSLLTALTDDPTQGSLGGWSLGTLSNASAGAVVVGLDVDYLTGDHRGLESTPGLIAAALQTGSVPTPGVVALLGVAGVGGLRRRR